MTPVGEDEGRRAGAAVQVLVGAADGEIDVEGVELDRHDAGAVAEVPDDEAPASMARPVRLRHVAQRTGAIVDVVDQHDGRPLVDHGGEVGVVGREASSRPGASRNAFGDVEVGGESCRARPG